MYKGIQGKNCVSEYFLVQIALDQENKPDVLKSSDLWRRYSHVRAKI